MPRRIHLEPHLTDDELQDCCRRAADPVERSRWHSSVTLRVPDHLHVLFLPAYSPGLQPAEHLWPLTNTALANRHFVSIDELEDAQVARCRVLQEQPDLIRRATGFSWWPRRIRRRQGPKRN